MSLKRRTVNSGNSNTSSVVSGNLVDGQEYEGRLVYVADLGLQAREYKGEQKDPAQQLSLGIEIIGETVEFEDGLTKPKILWTSPFYIYSKMSDKGKEYLNYKVFEPTAQADSVPDWEGQLDKPCSVTIKHASKDGNTYDNIGSITPIPKKYQDSVGEAVTEPCIGDADDPNNEATKALFGLAKWAYDRRLNEAVYDQGEVEYKEPYGDSTDIPF